MMRLHRERETRGKFVDIVVGGWGMVAAFFNIQQR